MQFGRVENPETIDYTLPDDAPSNLAVLGGKKKVDRPRLSIGHARWAKSYLKDFYPRGTKDELTYYATRLNSIEMNAFYYRIFKPEQVVTWREKTPPGFLFYPKIPQVISQFKRLRNAEQQRDDFIHSIRHFEDRLGAVFLQMPEQFSPTYMPNLIDFISQWPKDIPLHVELRHIDWFTNERWVEEVSQLFTAHGIGWILTDVAGRRDMLHMKLTSPKVFVRFTASGIPQDDDRLAEWVKRLKQWTEQGLEEVAFFIHQGAKTTSGLLSESFFEKMQTQFLYPNSVLRLPAPGQTTSLF